MNALTSSSAGMPLRALATALALLLAAPLAASASPSAATGEATTPRATGDIVDTAVAAGQFKTLAAALEAAGLVDTLKGPGPFTVFAPTDAAFAALPAGTVEGLLKPENREQLVAILTYHVVSGSYPAARVATLDSATTVNGANVGIRASDDGVTVDKARVVKADVAASNGVIHVIDAVLMPSN